MSWQPGRFDSHNVGEVLPPDAWAEDRAGRRPTFPFTWRNTLSNVAYPLAGLVVLWRDPGATGAAFALAMLLLGIGSACYHGTAEAWGQAADRAGMHLTFGALVVHGLAPEGDGRIALLMLAFGGFAAWAFVWRRYYSLDRSMGAYLAMSLLTAVLLGSWRLAVTSLSVFGVA